MQCQLFWAQNVVFRGESLHKNATYLLDRGFSHVMQQLNNAHIHLSVNAAPIRRKKNQQDCPSENNFIIKMFSSKLKIYKSLIRSVAIYGCEASTLTDRDERHLRIFERRILRNLFGPVQNENGSQRIRVNYELNKLIENADRVRFIKKQKNRLARSRDEDGRQEMS